MVRAKMICSEIAQRPAYSGPNPQGTTETVKLTAVMGEENKEWSQYTPSGAVELCITNPAAVAQFKVGKAYFVDFTPAAEG